MRSLEGLYRLLEPLHLYALRRDSLIDCELGAYAAGFALLEDLLEEIGRQAHVQTADGDGLLLHEKLVGLQQRGGVELADRRDLVVYRLSVAPFDFHRNGMLRSVRAAGMDAEIAENPQEESVTLTSRRLIDGFTDLEGVQRSVRRMLPAHLEAVFDIGELTWEQFETAGATWDEWDEKDFTWTGFDLDGHNIFTGGAA